jgi:hypothetical protein
MHEGSDILRLHYGLFCVCPSPRRRLSRKRIRVLPAERGGKSIHLELERHRLANAYLCDDDDSDMAAETRERMPRDSDSLNKLRNARIRDVDRQSIGTRFFQLFRFFAEGRQEFRQTCRRLTAVSKRRQPNPG